jgi:hypothetical protein
MFLKNLILSNGYAEIAVMFMKENLLLKIALLASIQDLIMK